MHFLYDFPASDASPSSVALPNLTMSSTSILPSVKWKKGESSYMRDSVMKILRRKKSDGQKRWDLVYCNH